MPGPAVGRCRIAATATAQPVKIRMKVPMSSATADPSRLLESTWLPYSPLGCSPLSSFCWPRCGLRVAEPGEPTDWDPRSKRTSSCRSSYNGSSALLRPSAASVRRTRGRFWSLGSLPTPDIPRLLSFSCLSSLPIRELSSALAVRPKRPMLPCFALRPFLPTIPFAHRILLKRKRARSMPGPALVSTPWATLAISAAPPRLVPETSVAASAARGGGVLDVYLFFADVLFDDLLVLDHVLADPQLLLDHRTLLDHNLFLYHRHGELVLADLGLGGLPALLD